MPSEHSSDKEPPEWATRDERWTIDGLLVYCSDFRCSHSGKISADKWPDHVRLSDLEPLFTCQACGIKGAELRPDFNWGKAQLGNVQRPTA
jgi:hypothetical protein